MNILLTGGTGYIGSHAAVVLVEAGHNVILFDNLSNSHSNVVDRLSMITNQSIPFIEGDVRDTFMLSKILKDYGIEAVMHFAGLKAVGESVEKPIEYFNNNVGGTISLLEAMHENRVKRLVFSSSATVYGEPQYLPIDENHPTSAINPYGRTKLHIGGILEDLVYSDTDWKIACLRYFNPVGAHESGLIGEDPAGIPNNLMPIIAMVAAGKLKYLKIFGNDYATTDGTGVRDYIHVIDLVLGHLSALNFLNHNNGCHFFNLGTGKGFTVFEMVKAFERVSNRKINYKISPRRGGDVASYCADVSKAKHELLWEARFDLNKMCESGWLWQSKS